METGNPDTSHLKGPCSLGAQNPTPASPECCLQSYFLPFHQTPIKHTNCCTEFLGWFVFFSRGSSCLFFISNTEKVPWALWCSPRSSPFSHAHPLSPTLTALLPAANLLQGQHFFPTQTINIQLLACSAEPEESSTSFIFRQFLLSDIRSPVISKLARHSSTQLN